MQDFFKDFLNQAGLDCQIEICQSMLDSYKVLIGEKIHLNGEGFDRLRREQIKDEDKE